MALKNNILSLLEQNRGVPISGSAMAERFGVSRNAVWKAVNALKNEGHMIEAVGRKGYALAENSNALSPEGIRSYINKDCFDMDIYIYKEIDSTNDEAKRYISKGGSKGAIFIANSQTKGKGRFGRDFYSPGETGLYFTLLFFPGKPVKTTALYTAAAAVAAARAIEKVSGVSPDIKWINDLYVHGRKICGILTEADTDFETAQVNTLILGVGINVTTSSFPGELKNKAASIGKPINRNMLAAEMINQMYKLWLTRLEGCMDEYRRRCFLIGRRVEVFDGDTSYIGTVTDITDECRLVIETGAGTKDFRFGEIRKF